MWCKEEIFVFKRETLLHVIPTSGLPIIQNITKIALLNSKSSQSYVALDKNSIFHERKREFNSTFAINNYTKKLTFKTSYNHSPIPLANSRNSTSKYFVIVNKNT